MNQIEYRWGVGQTTIIIIFYRRRTRAKGCLFREIIMTFSWTTIQLEYCYNYFQLHHYRVICLKRIFVEMKYSWNVFTNLKYSRKSIYPYKKKFFDHFESTFQVCILFCVNIRISILKKIKSILNKTTAPSWLLWLWCCATTYILLIY